MKKKRSLFRIVLAALLASTLVAWAVSTGDSYRMRRHLWVLADEKVQEFRAGPARGGKTIGDADITATISGGREYALYGRGIGKVTVFIRTPAPDGSSEYSSIEFYYQLDNDGQWVNTESAICADSECRVAALKAFKREDRPPAWYVSSSWF